MKTGLKIIKSVVRFLNRSRLRNKNFSLVSNTCLGGMISHELGLQFKSPTINCAFFVPEEFNVFVSNIDYYVNQPIDFISSDYKYPVGVLRSELGDVTIHFIHYSTEDEVRKKWYDRAKRLDLDNLFVLVDGDNCPEEDVEEFDRLNLKHKAIITMKDYSGLESVFVIKNPKYCQGDLLKTKLCGDALHWFELFDYVHFFNTGKIRSSRIFRNK